MWSVVRRRQRDELQAGRADLMPAAIRTFSALSNVLLLGDPALSAAAQELVEVTSTNATGTISRRWPWKPRADRSAVDDAVSTFGRLAGLMPDSPTTQ